MSQVDGVATVRSLAGFVKRHAGVRRDLREMAHAARDERRSRKAWVSRRGLATS